MATQQGPLNELSPELYPIIAAHLPLHATPSTLLALSLLNHHISEIALPLLYSRLILKDESDAIAVLQKLVDNPPLGRLVRQLHIMSDLSVEIQNQDPPSDVLRRVEDIVLKGYLPFIHTLGLHLMERWYYDRDKDFEPVEGFGQLRKEFWVQLKDKCPRLRGLVLRGFADNINDPWLEESGLLRVQSITSLTIRLKRTTLWQSKSGSDKLLLHISSLAPSLHTLNLRLNSSHLNSTSSLFKLDFPFLRSLSLASFLKVGTAQATAFFERHPSIEYLDVASNPLWAKMVWFASDLPKTFLPNLRHLRAHWKDVRLLAPILDQLLSLSIHKSVNAQIPYLFRFVLPNGVPNLKSLGIGQAALSSGKNKTTDGKLWYENEDGTFQQANKQEYRTVFDSYMHSIVRAAPNLEEIGFHGTLFELSKFVSIADDLNGFPHLKHLYYKEHDTNFKFTEEERDTFASEARDLAKAVPGLLTITNVDTRTLPYLTARISRRENGEIADVKVGKGYGMQIGYDDEAFPWAPRDSS